MSNLSLALCLGSKRASVAMSAIAQFLSHFAEISERTEREPKWGLAKVKCARAMTVSTGNVIPSRKRGKLILSPPGDAGIEIVRLWDQSRLFWHKSNSNDPDRNVWSIFVDFRQNLFSPFSGGYDISSGNGHTCSLRCLRRSVDSTPNLWKQNVPVLLRHS